MLSSLVYSAVDVQSSRKEATQGSFWQDVSSFSWFPGVRSSWHCIMLCPCLTKPFDLIEDLGAGGTIVETGRAFLLPLREGPRVSRGFCKGCLFKPLGFMNAYKAELIGLITALEFA
ncbi:hypothetical protein TIFTF001_032983 [Ficus carica]|uniref:Uncharacterized protein n=1 Tax=Ficus carica TaxID=3494 RepID=A0AA88J7D6_FICCA|nr:hypothetical protein TIFTF001_032983 [Ficus carica]